MDSENRDRSAMQVHHFSHDHPLVLDRTEGDGEICNLCLKPILCQAFTCSDCGFLLHKKCAQLPRELRNHHLHPQHPLVLVQSRHSDMPESPKCSLCEKKCSGYAFRCDACDYNVDVSCFLRTQLYPDMPSRQKTRQLRHVSHPHKLLLRYCREENNSMLRSCRACEMPASGPTYYCPECPDFLLHKYCSELSRQIQHPFHSSHPLILQTESPYPTGNLYCDACRKTIRNGFVFHCSICKFDLDATCASRVASLRHEKHNQHPLAFFDDVGIEVPCNICGIKSKENIYRCVPCNFNAHSTCLPFASVIWHKQHRHFLSLKESVVKGNLGWFPCEVCKKKITPKHRVYYCEDCSYGVHLECVNSISKEPPVSDLKYKTLFEEFAAELKVEVDVLSMKFQTFLENISKTRLNEETKGCKCN